MRPDRLPARGQEQAALARLRARPVNFDPRRRKEFTPGLGWHLDDLRQPLPTEPPGDPVAGSTWATARSLMQGYDFADPSIVRAWYEPDEPLEARTMLLELRFWGLRFRVGVRVAEVYDEEREVRGRPVRVWGWAYQTLEGHLEMGQMNWEVWKWLDSGEVAFRIHAFSRPAPIPNPLVRLGFRLFGRREQLRFLRSTSERMLRLTEAALAGGPDAPERVRRTAEALTAKRAGGAAEAHYRLAGNVERAGRGATPAPAPREGGRGRRD